MLTTVLTDFSYLICEVCCSCIFAICIPFFTRNEQQECTEHKMTDKHLIAYFSLEELEFEVHLAHTVRHYTVLSTIIWRASKTEKSKKNDEINRLK